MIQVTVHGAEGRMGRLVTELIEGSDDLQLAALVTEVGATDRRATSTPGCR